MYKVDHQALSYVEVLSETHFQQMCKKCNSKWLNVIRDDRVRFFMLYVMFFLNGNGNRIFVWLIIEIFGPKSILLSTIFFYN